MPLLEKLDDKPVTDDGILYYKKKIKLKLLAMIIHINKNKIPLGKVINSNNWAFKKFQ